MSGGSRLFSELLDEYIHQWKGRDTNQVYRLAHWRRELGNFRIIDISTQLLRQKIKEFHRGHCLRGNGKQKSKMLPRPRANATVNRHRVTLSAVFSYAIREGYLIKNPVAKVASQPVNNNRIRYLSDIERMRLFEACQQSTWPRLYLLVLLAT